MKHFKYFSNLSKRIQNTAKTSRMEPFVKVVNGSKLLTIFVKNSILDTSDGSEYVFGYDIYYRKQS